MCFDGVKRLCHIRGKLRKKVWINQSDIVLIGLRETQEEGLDQSIGHCPHRSQGLPGCQGRRDPEVLGRRGEEPEVLRRVP